MRSGTDGAIDGLGSEDIHHAGKSFAWTTLNQYLAVARSLECPFCRVIGTGYSGVKLSGRTARAEVLWDRCS